MDFEVDTTHADVHFVNFNVFVFPVGFWVFPLVFGEIDVDSVKGKIDVLSGKIDPGWNSVNHIAIF